MASETSRISMPRPSPWTWSMRSALLDCSTISAIRASSMTSAPAKPWTSGCLTTSRRAASPSLSWKRTRGPPVEAPTANMQRLATSAIVGGRRRASRIAGRLLVGDRAFHRVECLAEAPVEQERERPGERGAKPLAVLEVLVGDEDGRRREVDVGMQLQIAGELRVVVDPHDQAVARRRVAETGEVDFLRRDLSARDGELRRGGKGRQDDEQRGPHDECRRGPSEPGRGRLAINHADLLQGVLTTP